MEKMDEEFLLRTKKNGKPTNFKKENYGQISSLSVLGVFDFVYRNFHTQKKLHVDFWR